MNKAIKNWKDDTKVLSTQSKDFYISKLVNNRLIYTKNSFVFQIIRIFISNASNLDQFVGLMQFEIKEPKTYIKAMKELNAIKWARKIKKVLNQFYKNNTWILIPRNKMELSYLPLWGKWVYKVKRDVNDNIIWFKARWIVKDYF